MKNTNDGATAASVMDPNPTWVRPDDRIGTGAKYIMEHRYRNLPVIDEEGRYLGIFGVNCLLRLVLPKAAVMAHGIQEVSFIHETLADLHERLREVQNKPISCCMSTDVSTVPPDKPLVESLLILYRTKISIPVVDPATGKLLGMISYWDVGEHILSA
jgi:CBS-domain-containing membrane protein